MIKDENNLPKLSKQLKAVDGKKVQVGFLGDDDLTMIAGVQEFGATIKPKKSKFLTIPVHKSAKGKSPRDFKDLTFIPSKNPDTAILAKVNGKSITTYFVLKKEVIIPERSFVRSSFDNKKEINKIIDEAKEVFDIKKEPNKILARIGARMIAVIQKKIKSNISPKNAPVTTEMKGGKNKTLVDTGRLVQGVGYKIK